MPRPSAYSLPPTLTAENAASLRDELLRARPTTLDASGVTHIGTPGIQVLLAFSRHMHEEGTSITVKGMSEVLQEALRDLGISTDPEQWVKDS
ncbi:MAG: STAS domain-containing protein [Alphaproteobacteria bacterium]|nr:STAS domain-containing protein [Alphaproteobacteria bacterium]